MTRDGEKDILVGVSHLAIKSDDESILFMVFYLIMKGDEGSIIIVGVYRSTTRDFKRSIIISFGHFVVEVQ